MTFTCQSPTRSSQGAHIGCPAIRRRIGQRVAAAAVWSALGLLGACGGGGTAPAPDLVAEGPSAARLQAPGSSVPAGTTLTLQLAQGSTPMLPEDLLTGSAVYVAEPTSTRLAVPGTLRLPRDELQLPAAEAPVVLHASTLAGPWEPLADAQAPTGFVQGAVSGLGWFVAASARPRIPAAGQPQPADVTEGASAHFEVQAEGRGPMQYLWQRSDDEGQRWADVPGANSPQYELQGTRAAPAAAGGDSGALFRVRVSNSFGRRLSQTARLQVSAVAPGAANARSAIGANLQALTDWGGNWIYTDFFRSARPWVSGELFGCWSCGPALDLDAQGWVRTLQPGMVARSVVLTNPGENFSSEVYPAGAYTVTWEGAGELAYGGAAQRNDALSRPGRDVVDVRSERGSMFYLELRQTTAANPVRNIRVLPPGGVCTNDATRSCMAASDCTGGASCRAFADTTTAPARFHPDFLRNSAHHGVLRFLQETGVNDEGIEAVVEPEHFTRPDDAFWLRMPPEVMGELANALRSDVWVNVPVNASDALVRSMAQRLAATLSTRSRVFVEYSNESWNSAWPYVLQQRILAVRGCAANADLSAGCDADDNPGNGQFCEGHPWPRFVRACFDAEGRAFSERTVQVGRLFREVLGATHKVIRVMASQTGFTDRHERLLSWQNAHAEVDALATAPYFGGGFGNDPATVGMTLDQLFAQLDSQALPLALDEVVRDAALLRTRYPALDLVAYEGGQHLVGVNALQDNATLHQLFRAANNDARMGGLYTRYLQGWRAQGGKTFVHFADVGAQSRYGNFGALTAQNQPHAASPKFLALRQFVADNPCWWAGCEFGGAWGGR
jgi:hypothetical protein